MTIQISKTTKTALIMTAIFACLIAIHFFRFHRSCLADNSLINPRFACGNGYVIDKKEYADLKTSLNADIEAWKREGKADFVSIYFRDLVNGPTMGIMERVDFIPASLLKLPLAFAYYDYEQEHNGALEAKIAFGETAPVPTQTFMPAETIKKGSEYSIEELIERMLVSSDNSAAQLLFENLPNLENPTALSEIYRDLGILEMGSSLEKEAVNAKGYGSIFVRLFNVSLLGPEHSEKLLTLLARSEFQDGLVAGVPEGVVVAHKFGERFTENSKQLHDCGIVYFPDNPYLLCVMTRGQDFESLAEIVRSISRSVYEEVNSRKI
jgi:beta-lactamase class A